MSTKTTKVLIVDDSALVRQLLTGILSGDPSLEVVGAAVDPYDARAQIKQFNPDVITLDVEMPRMDGITFLRNLMRLRPMPVVMISTLTEKGSTITLEALELGAVDYIAKPKFQLGEELNKQAEQIIQKVKHAARANLQAIEHNFKHEQFTTPLQPGTDSQLTDNIGLIAIGASTGGTEAIKEVLSGLPGHMPPIVVVQHMPGGFTHSYAKRLDQCCALTVKEFDAEREKLESDHVYIANGDYHMATLVKNDQLYATRRDTDPVNRHKPAVDVLFQSIAECAGNRAIGILLTGMGIDGASGLGNMRNSGAITIAQDEKSSVVWGMPRVAIEQQAASEVLALNNIGPELLKLCYHTEQGQ